MTLRRPWHTRLLASPRRQRLALLLLLAMVLGGLCTLISYPGIFYSDSYGRWFMAREMARLNMAVQDDWLSVPPQLVMAVLYKLTQNYASFTLLQSVVFFFTAFCAIGFFCPAGRVVTGVLFCLCPVFYGFAVYVEMSVLCGAALLWLLMLVLGVPAAAWAGWGRWRRVGYCAVCFGLYGVMLGFRQNAFTVLVVVAAVLLWRAHAARAFQLPVMHGASAAAALLLVAMLPGLLGFGIRNGSGPASTGFLWETVAVLQQLGDDAPPEYHTMLNYLGGEGTTQAAVQGNHYDSIYGYHAAIPNTVVGSGQNASRIWRDYFGLMWRQPGAFWTVKTRFWARTLGISQPLSAGEYDYDRDGRMAEFGFTDTPRRRQFHHSYHAFMQAVPLVRMPWLCFVLAAGVLLAAGRRALGKTARSRLWVLFCAAGCFYASFLITTQSQEFRYFFVPFWLLALVAAGSVGALCRQGLAWLRRRAGTPHWPGRHTPQEDPLGIR